MMKQCRECGTISPDDTIFCYVCGTKFIDSRSEGLSDKFRARIHVLTKEQGGRHTPFFNNYKPMISFPDEDVRGTITIFDEGKEMVMPGEDVTVNIVLDNAIMLSCGLAFVIHEGESRVVGNGEIIQLNA